MNISVHAQINILPEIIESFPQMVEDALDEGVITTVEVAMPLTPIDTGALRANVTMPIARTPGYREITWNQHYAIYQEFGTSHGIRANLFATQGADAGTEAVQAALADWGEVMQTVFLSRIANRELYKLLDSVNTYPIYRGYQFPEKTTLPATLFYLEHAMADTGGHTEKAEHLTASTFRYVVRTDGFGESDSVIATEAETLIGAVAGAIVDTDDGYQLTFTFLGETPITSIYDGAQQYQRLGAIYQVYVTKG